MSVTDYSKTLEKADLTFEGNKISEACKDLLKGLLEKNINDRMSFDHVISHPWIVYTEAKAQEISEKYSSDPEKMIQEMNKVVSKEEDFKNEYCYDLEITSYLKGNKTFINKKRRRSKILN
jgi:hypothetical protein